jgi:CheY-like chemotaxis protein
MRILAVDDSSSARKVFQNLLVGLGIESSDVRLASDAVDGLRIATEWAPEIVFLDMELEGPALGLPPQDGGSGRSAGRSGDSLGRALLRRSPRPKIVMVTALDRDDARVKALLQDGAVDVIMKPVRAARVHEVLQHLGYFPAPTRGR